MSTPPTLPEFTLVTFDNFGYRQPLPQGLGNLPLYPDQDGIFSVNGPLDLTVSSSHETRAPVNCDNQSTICPLSTSIPGFSGQNLQVTPNRHLHHLYDNISRLVPSTTSRASCYSFLSELFCSGPQARSKKRSYLCREPGCTWRFSFPTKQGLDRHHEVRHLDKRVDCPIPGCNKVGDKGIKRKDNLLAHVWNKHGIKLSRESLHQN